MEIIKFNIEQLLEEENGFSYYILGRSYDLEENGLLKDLNRALSFYKKGYELGYPLCIYSLGISYLFGLEDVLPIDKTKGEEHLKKAWPMVLELIDNPNTPNVERIYAKFVTGAYYYFGLGNIDIDYEKAFSIIKECADNGHIAAIYDLGANFYFNGRGTNKDLKLARDYLNLAKDYGLPRALKLYSERYEN